MVLVPARTGRPRFRRHLRAEIGAAGVFLFGEHGVTALQGTAVAAVAALLDGTHELESVVAARPAGLDETQVRGMIDQLVTGGLVTFAPGPTTTEEERALAWWEACGVDAGVLEGSARVGLTVLGEHVETAPLSAALASAGLDTLLLDSTAMSGAPPGALDLGVVLCADYLDPGLAAVDAVHRAAGRPWLLAKLDGARTWIGPVFRPGGACWHCLSHRLWGHRHAEAVVQRSLNLHGPARRPASSLPSVSAAVAHLVALEASKWLAGHRYPGQGCVWVFDTHNLAGEHHELAGRPQCPSCGDAGLVAARTRVPVRLQPAPKAVGSGDRVLTAKEMLTRHVRLVSPVTGIIKQITADPSVPGFAHAFRSGANVSRQVDGLVALRRSLRAENGGKGLTEIDARVGALCEAAERFSGTEQGDELRIPGTLRDLAPSAVDPRDCLLFDDRQYADRAAWNAAHAPFNHVPAPFDPDAELDWTPVWSLTHRRHRLLPTAMLYYGGPPAPGVFADSNGAAAGGSVEDAVLQGLLELVERDAVAIWWYNRLRVPEVDPSAFGDPAIVAQRAHHASIGRELHVLDVTSDLGIPTVVAVSRRAGGGQERILLGFGAHLDPAAALRRALAEVNQMLPGDAMDPSRSDDPDWRDWATRATFAGHPHLLPDPGARPRGPGDHPHEWRPDVRDDVLAVVDRLAAHGLETLVLDQTRPDVGLPVVKVVVPGLRSFWARFAPGRLFDVPVATGALDRPTPYASLNPVPLFL
ncbi:MAG: TOMM biosynthesis cyclodehydratase (protein C) / TOMM biosynthesis docking scaffold (protein D) [uncultured Pseudonocardia sp.]|uniref:TOMM biosynthesis cyclodehydratase (Protein C) / TOMM biosynthesis docking scaffold (Protein D) n=1 Tax=uncultured Pseudonocardia sp. TaxID=211455 RepID=A0A6J4PJQ3_9PSEU|nr:MAG: TOMM biosynthesis cyclodehydratase (protein C) / TOMM biosynthesis docking scaffold (protein D) [uncultured Pseudonocardia sp.]